MFYKGKVKRAMGGFAISRKFERWLIHKLFGADYDGVERVNPATNRGQYYE